MSTPSPDLVTMSWDPITRIVGSLGIHAQIDFANRRVVECHGEPRPLHGRESGR